MATLAEALETATQQLEHAGIAAPRRAAELLLLHVLGQPRAFLFAHGDATLTGEQQARFEHLVARRGEGTPAQYLTGVQEFYGREFHVTPAVLIPRPETELAIEAALEQLKTIANPTVIDVGTGSGCIAVTLALERRDARVLATDVSGDALAVAEVNARRLGAHVELLHGDLLEPLLTQRGLKGDLVISNPPYVAEREFPGLQREVRDYEPRVALTAGLSGIEVYERLLPQAHSILRPGGWLVMEIGYNAADAVRGLLRHGWERIEIRPDLQGFDRVAIAARGNT